MSDEYTEFAQHQFGPGTLRELATKLYKNPIAAYREAVSNALDQMINYPQEQRIEIYTNVLPDGDLIIEDWGTGIEDYKKFRTISSGEKVVNGEVSSYERINEKIIGQKGMGKLSFLNLSSENKVEFHSNSKEIGLKVLMTMDGFEYKFLNSTEALPHHGLKIVIKRAKKPVLPETRLIEYLSKVFAIRIARGLKLSVNRIPVHKPEDFDSRQFKLFELKGGIPIYGDFKHTEKSRLNNIEIFVKTVFVTEKDFDYKVEGWINCDQLELDTSRDGIYEANEVYADFTKRLMQYLEENFEKKSERKDKQIGSGKQIAKIFVSVVKTIANLYPEMTKPLMSGNLLHEEGIGSLSNLQGDASDPCVEQKGTIDITKKTDRTIGKPIGNGKSHKQGIRESTARIMEGEDKILAPSKLLFSGKDVIPEPKVVIIKNEEKPVVYFSTPNRLVINEMRPSSEILLDAKPKDPAIKSRILPLLVRAGIDAFPGSSAISKEEWWKKYDVVLDNVWSK